MDRLGSADRDVVGHYSRLLWPRRFGVRLVAAVMRIALVENRVIDDEIGVVRRIRGQTMTEYTLILVAVALAVFGAYVALGNSVSSLAIGVDSTLTSA
jgi:Flp pilus assembly pilin Flp